MAPNFIGYFVFQVDCIAAFQYFLLESNFLYDFSLDLNLRIVYLGLLNLFRFIRVIEYLPQEDHHIFDIRFSLHHPQQKNPFHNPHLVQNVMILSLHS